MGGGQKEQQAMNDYRDRGHLDGPRNPHPPCTHPISQQKQRPWLWHWPLRHGPMIWLGSAWVRCHRQAGSGLSAAVLDRRRRGRGWRDVGGGP